MDDAREVLRMDGQQVSEYAVRLKDFGKLTAFGKKLDGLLAKELNQQNKPIFELHTWEKLSPFFNIAQMIDLMTFFIKLMLIAISELPPDQGCRALPSSSDKKLLRVLFSIRLFFLGSKDVTQFLRDEESIFGKRFTNIAKEMSPTGQSKLVCAEKGEHI